jgi:glycosyltransferase involved in cell wall biosynthesis
MPVHNAMPHLDQAIESILGQTFADFEFVILDDASTDGSGLRLKEWAARDDRIRLIHADQNLGPVRSSNKVARAAKAAVVARMDADDISHPERLSRQFELLRENPDVGVVASVSDMIDSDGRNIRGPEVWRLWRRSPFVPFAHGAMMYRRDLFDAVGGYREECEYWEDQDLVVRMAAIAKVAVIASPLYTVRQSRTSTRALCGQQRLELALDRAYEATDRLRHRDDWVIESDRGDAPAKKLDPRVFIAVGSVRLWAGERPRLFRRMLSHGELSWDIRTASALTWTAWASVSPSSLRIFLTFLLRARNRLASPLLSTENAVYWRPQRAAEKIHKGDGHP